MATAAETIHQVQQCTTLAQLAELEAHETALPRPRRTVQDAILDRRTQLTTVPGKGQQAQEASGQQAPEPPKPKATEAKRPAAQGQPRFKSMKGKVVVFGKAYTKAEALQHPEVMAALVKARSLTLARD